MGVEPIACVQQPRRNQVLLNPAKEGRNEPLTRRACRSGARREDEGSPGQGTKAGERRPL